MAHYLHLLKNITISTSKRWGIPFLTGGLCALILVYIVRITISPSPDTSPTSFAEAIKKVMPTVVNIATEDKSLGSGVLINDQGVIITNHHLINEADLVTVTLHDGRKSIATLLGSDVESDVAILQIPITPLPYTPNQIIHERVEVGDIVLAIGNPYGVGQTVTQGIVSAINRSDLGLNTFEQYIQTDAAINPGNSGGALITADGHLIGINSAFLSHAEGAQGIGFAIPMTQIESIMKDIVRFGRVSRGYLGVKLHQLNRETASFFNLDHTNGLVVVAIAESSPAEAAGLQAGDVILGIDETRLQRGNDALLTIARLPPGKTVSLSLYRAGKLEQIEATLAARNPELKASGFH